jgi:hypothetical protein
MRALILSLTLLAAGPALACINDRAIEVDEEEFRSSYGEGEQSEARHTPLVTAGVAGGGLAGLALLGSALYMARRSSRD